MTKRHLNEKYTQATRDQLEHIIEEFMQLHVYFTIKQIRYVINNEYNLDAHGAAIGRILQREVIKKNVIRWNKHCFKITTKILSR